ncbi:hypothetical protein BJY04DRAFT_202900 [Aspergillus karnatakaensis]|uniref:uncharacterized protein n=1 Tax=Aspergillus karnatakaensis TaxID=1810916 RepID=UPI003CCD1AA5
MDACYSMHKGIISKNVASIPCGVTNNTNPYVTCCVRGDYCMSDSVCHFKNPDGNEGYYRADCTDPTLQSPACATRCGARHLSDIHYNSSTGFWSCCSYDDNGKANCEAQSSEIWPGPAPSNLVEIQFLPEEGTPVYAVAESSTNSSHINESGSGSASETEPSSSSSISIGAAVGGGLGAGLGLFLILCAVLFFVQRRRSRKAGEGQGLTEISLKEEEGPRSISQMPVSYQGRGELPSEGFRGSRSQPGELEGDYNRF